jgi:hypothetical protein
MPDLRLSMPLSLDALKVRKNLGLDRLTLNGLRVSLSNATSMMELTISNG